MYSDYFYMQFQMKYKENDPCRIGQFQFYSPNRNVIFSKVCLKSNKIRRLHVSAYQIPQAEDSIC